jgi:hypothetical protein
MEKHTMLCGHSTSVDDMCSACFDDVLELLKAFVAAEQLGEEVHVQDYCKAQMLIQKHDRPSVCKYCGFYHPGGSCLDS